MGITGHKSLGVCGAVGLALNVACYSYVPVTATVAPKATDVRVQLNPAGTTDLARFLGPRVTSVDGRIAAVGPDGSMLIGVTWVELANGPRQLWTGQGVVTFPQAYIASLQQRTLNRRKSIIAGIAIGSAVLVLTAIALNGGGGQGPQDPVSDGGFGAVKRMPHIP